MAGATAAAAAGVNASQAGTITINLINNYISATGGNHLNADLTGDGQPDLTITGAAYSVFTGYYHRFNNARVNLNGVAAEAFLKSYDFPYNFGTAKLGSLHRIFYTSFDQHNSTTIVGLIPISFKDLRINGGARTSGSLEVTVLSSLIQGPEIRLDTLTYTSKTLDQGSSLALLAMGAGGVLALRRWRGAQKDS